jgi:hypothetical protein
MKTAVIYYSWSGHTRKLAEARARKETATLFEVKDARKPAALKAFTAGCYASMRMKRVPVQPFTAPLGKYERIVIMAPVWVWHPAPAILAAFDTLPPGKEVAVCLVSGGGKSACRKQIQALVESKGCKLTEYEDIRGALAKG